MRDTLGAAAVIAAALASAGCGSYGVSPCERRFPAADVSVTVTPTVSLRAVQRDDGYVNGGCAYAVPVRLALVSRAATPLAVEYRVTWRGRDGAGWSRDGSLARLAPGASADIGVVDDAAPLGDGALAAELSHVQVVAAP